MAVTFAKIHETATTADLPVFAAATAQTNTFGINSSGGPVEFLMIRGDCLFSADPAAADVGNLLESLRVICNGEVYFDFRAGYSDGTNNACSLFTYFNNKIGGRCYEIPGTTTREWYWAIPIGRQLPAGVNRWEIIMSWSAGPAGVTVTSGKLEMWLRMNSGMEQQTTIISPTSFTSTADAIEMVTVRVPQNVPGVVSAIFVQNDSAANEIGTQGIRVNSISSFGMENSMWQWLNGDLENGILYADHGADAASQSIAIEVKGGLLIPCFGLAGGDIVLQVNSTANTTRTYTPVITSAINAKTEKSPVQTETVRGSTAQAIINPTKN